MIISLASHDSNHQKDLELTEPDAFTTAIALSSLLQVVQQLIVKEVRDDRPNYYVITMLLHHSPN